MHTDSLIFGLMFMFSLTYALILQFSEERLRFVSQETWITVIVGVAATLAMIALFDEIAYWKLWVSFATTGSCVVLRSIINRVVAHSINRNEVIHRATPGD